MRRLTGPQLAAAALGTILIAALALVAASVRRLPPAMPTAVAVDTVAVVKPVPADTEAVDTAAESPAARKDEQERRGSKSRQFMRNYLDEQV